MRVAFFVQFRNDGFMSDTDPSFFSGSPLKDTIVASTRMHEPVDSLRSVVAAATLVSYRCVLPARALHTGIITPQPGNGPPSPLVS